jgi:hypothetical protein
MRCRPVLARLTEVADFDILLSHPPLIHHLFYVLGDDFHSCAFSIRLSSIQTDCRTIEAIGDTPYVKAACHDPESCAVRAAICWLQFVSLRHRHFNVQSTGR